VALRLLTRARTPVQLAQAQVAVGDERAHPEFLRERERVTVVGFGVLRGTAARRDVTEDA
jgi:hypothetical protein